MILILLYRNTLTYVLKIKVQPTIYHAENVFVISKFVLL